MLAVTAGDVENQPIKTAIVFPAVTLFASARVSDVPPPQHGAAAAWMRATGVSIAPSVGRVASKSIRPQPATITATAIVARTRRS
jgi:hypothetical protein